MDRKNVFILLIEDNPGDARLVREMLPRSAESRETVYSLEWVENLEAGLKRVDVGGIDLVLLDLGLPESDGLDTLRRLRSEATLSPAVVIMTGIADENLATEAVKSGAQDYLIKGNVDSRMLGRSIRYSLERHEAAVALQRVNDELEGRVTLRTEELTTANQQLRQSLKALHESEEQFRSLVSNLPGIVYRCDCDEHWTMRYISDFVEVLTGYPADEFVQNRIRSFASVIHPDDRAMVARAVEEALPKRQPYVIEYRIITADNTVKWVYERGLGVHSSEGQLLWLDGVILDNTESRRAEETLRAIADYTYDWESWFAPDGRLMWLNPAVERLTGYSPEECCEMSDYPLPIIHEDDRIEFRNRLHEAIEKRDSVNDFIFRVTRKDGSVGWMAVSWQPIYNAQGGHIGQRTSIRDITERVQSERELSESREKYQYLFDNMSQGVMVHDNNGQIIETNRAALEITGLTFSQLQELASRGMMLELIHEDGSPFDPADFPSNMALRTGKPVFEVLCGLYRSAEESPRWLLLSSIPRIGNEAHEPSMILTVLTDVTNRRELELKLIDANFELQDQQKMLSEKNVALKEVLRQIDDEKSQLTNQIQMNIEEVIGPIVKSLRIGSPPDLGKHLDLLESSLGDISSSFASDIRRRFGNLSPRELEICQMIRKGFSSKDIAMALNVSVYTVHNQRHSIRRKLGIIDDHVSLVAFLENLP